MSDDLLATFEKVIKEVVNNKNLVVKAESLLVNDLGLESIDLLDISSELENTLGWELDFREVAEGVAQKTGQRADMKSLKVQDLLDFVAAKG